MFSRRRGGQQPSNPPPPPQSQAMPPIPRYQDKEDRVEIVFSILEGDYQTLIRLADEDDVSEGEYIRKALANYAYLRRAINAGSKVYIEYPKDPIEITFR